MGIESSGLRTERNGNERSGPVLRPRYSMESKDSPQRRGDAEKYQERLLVDRQGRRRSLDVIIGTLAMLGSVVVIDPEVMNGTPCFRGTRVPFKNLIDYLEGGHSLGEFLQQFPTVTREMAVQALEEARESLVARIA